jgi:hypothetical protein
MFDLECGLISPYSGRSRSFLVKVCRALFFSLLKL